MQYLTCQEKKKIKFLHLLPKIIIRGNYLFPPSTTSHCQHAPMN
jgi:hypothetical protein